MRGIRKRYQLNDPTDKRTYCHPIIYYVSMIYYFIWGLICILGCVFKCHEKLTSPT
jgi:hypothetical protein